jgi:hypothetical protein
VLPVVALLLLLAGVLVIGVTRVATRAAAADHARVTADLVALPAAAGGRPAADRVAAANGAALVSYEVSPAGVRVDIALGSRHASARAISDASGGVPPALRAVLARAAQVVGRPVAVRRWGGDGLSISVDATTAAVLHGREAETGLCGGQTPAWFEICLPGER